VQLPMVMIDIGMRFPEQHDRVLRDEIAKQFCSVEGSP